MDKILIVDDSATIRKLLLFHLKNEPYVLLESCDGLQAVDACLREHPDLVISDIQMPQLDGYGLCRRLQQDPRTQDIPIIFLSARAEAADKIKGLELGAVDYITKPFDRGEILVRIRNQLKIRHLTRSLMDANRQLREKQRRIAADLEAAAQIQKSLLPAAVPRFSHVGVAWRFFPCEQVGGDVINIFQLDEEHLSAFVLDVSGHGVPSAMVTVSVCQALLSKSDSILKRPISHAPFYELAAPAQVLTRLDQEFPFERFEKYFTMVYLVLNIRSGRVRYCNAAHPRPVLLREDGRLEMLESGGTVIGMGTGVPFEDSEVCLQSGDRIFLYTDGIVEYADSSGEFFGEERFCRRLQETRTISLDAVCESVIQSMTALSGEFTPQDDITLLALEFQG